MTLTPRQRQFLKAQAHDLKPVVLVGQKGLTEGVQREVERALTDHELVKIRLGDLGGPEQDERDARQEAATGLAKGCDAEVVAHLGKMVILYRPHPEKPRIRLPR